MNSIYIVYRRGVLNMALCLAIPKVWLTTMSHFLISYILEDSATLRLWITSFGYRFIIHLRVGLIIIIAIKISLFALFIFFLGLFIEPRASNQFFFLKLFHADQVNFHCIFTPNRECQLFLLLLLSPFMVNWTLNTPQKIS